jgi:hypothetical protein
MAKAHNPNGVGVESFHRQPPRVARASQPWAARHNPFGIAKRGCLSHWGPTFPPVVIPKGIRLKPALPPTPRGCKDAPVVSGDGTEKKRKVAISRHPPQPSSQQPPWIFVKTSKFIANFLAVQRWAAVLPGALYYQPNPIKPLIGGESEGPFANA